MNNKEFRDKIEEFAIVQDVKPVPGKFRDKFVDEEYLDEDGEVIELTKDTNTTLGFEIVKLRDNVHICELGCGNIVANQVVDISYLKSPVPHIRRKCSVCKLYQHPFHNRIRVQGGQINQILLQKVHKPTK